MAENRRSWLGRALYWQSAIVTLLTGGFCLLVLLDVHFSLTTQVIVLLGGIVLVGFPHGAFDHLVAQPILSGPLGRWWWVVFVLAYCGLAGMIFIAWAWVPQITLVAFLCVTILHFGLGDTEDGLAPAHVPRILTTLIYGIFPVLLPVSFHSNQASPVLAAMAHMSSEELLPVLSASRWLLPPWAIAFMWVIISRLREHEGIAERLIAVAGFIILPPLLAFGLYFGFGHSIRHVLRLGAWHDPYAPRVAMRWALRVILPASIVCIIGISAFFLFDSEIITGLVAPIFQVIAALTFPHIIVTSWLSRHDQNEINKAT